MIGRGRRASKFQLLGLQSHDEEKKPSSSSVSSLELQISERLTVEAWGPHGPLRRPQQEILAISGQLTSAPISDAHQASLERAGPGEVTCMGFHRRSSSQALGTVLESVIWTATATLCSSVAWPEPEPLRLEPETLLLKPELPPGPLQQALETACL